MLVFSITFLCIIFAAYGIISYKFLLNPLTVMGIVWAFIVPISSLDIYGVYPVSDYAYYIIMIGLLAYFIGASIGASKIQFVIKKKSKRNESNPAYKTNYKLLYVLNTIAIIFFLYQFYQVILLLAEGMDYSYIRELYTAEEANELRSSRFIMIIRSFIATPTVYLGVALLPRELMKKSKNKTVIFQLLLMLFLWVLTSGGRSIIIWFVIYYITMFSFLKDDLRFNWRVFIKKNLKKIVFFSLILGAFFYWMTISRKGEDVDLLHQMYTYFIAPIPFFDLQLSKINLLENNAYGFGLSSFYGFFYPFLFIVRALIGEYPDNILNIYNLSFFDLEQTVHLGGKIYMNAFATIFYQPYIDGREFGVILILGIFGFISGKIFFKARYQNNKKYLLFYLLIIQKIIFSFVRFYFTQTSQTIAFVLALFIDERIRKKERL